MKKITIGILVIIFIFIIGSYSFSSKTTCEIIDPTIITFDNPSEKFLSPAEIGEELLHQWLTLYKSDDVCENNKISEYTVNEVRGIESATSTLSVRIDINVHPIVSNNSNWLVGNGALNGEWINNKIYIMDIVKEGTTYKISNITLGE